MEAARAVGRRLLWRHDYMPLEFALFLFREDHVSSQSVLNPSRLVMNRS